MTVSQAETDLATLEAGQRSDGEPQPPVLSASNRSMPPAGGNHGKCIAYGIKRVLCTSTKAYLSFVGIGAAIKLAKNPADMGPDALQFVRAAFTGTSRADSLEVQQGREIVLKTYGDFIDTKTQCVDPVITFVPALSKWKGGPQTSGQFSSRSAQRCAPPAFGNVSNVGNLLNATGTDNSTAGSSPPGATRVQTGVLRFTTYNLYLPEIAVHEYLHCFTHPDFYDVTDDTRLDDQTSHALVEGTTQYLTLKAPFDRRGDYSGKYSGIYADEVKFIGKVIDGVGIETMKKAYFSGDQTAIGKVREAAVRTAENPSGSQ